MTRPLIGLIGHKQAGKDSLAAELVSRHGYTRVAFADPLREVALALDPWIDIRIVNAHSFRRLSAIVAERGWDDAKKIPEVRRVLQHLGVAVRAQDPDFWVRQGMAAATGRDAVVTDVRFPNEADAIRADGGVLVRVTRDVADEAAALDPHESEHALDDFDVDLTIDNNGSLHDLETQAAAVAAYTKTRP